MPAATWRQRVGDIPAAGDSSSSRRGRPTFSVAGPRNRCFSTFEYLPQETLSSKRSSLTEAAYPLHKFPFRAPSPKPQPFSRAPSETPRSRASSACRPMLDVDLAQRASEKGPAPPREVQTLWKHIEGALSAQLDQVQPCAGSEAIMRRISRDGLRAKYIDKGRNATAAARAPLQRTC
jgi:hypothetical protein